MKQLIQHQIVRWLKPHNRGNDVSTKGDRIKDVSIGIVDIDTAIIKYIEEKLTISNSRWK